MHTLVCVCITKRIQINHCALLLFPTVETCCFLKGITVTSPSPLLKVQFKYSKQKDRWYELAMHYV